MIHHQKELKNYKTSCIKIFPNLFGIVVSFVLIIDSPLFAYGTENPNIQKGELAGNIIDASTGHAIEYASVSVFKQTDSSFVAGTITNSSGVFIIKGLPYGNYFLTVQFLGYKKLTLNNVSIANKNVNIKTISLKEVSNELGTVTVSAEKNLIEQKIDKRVLNLSQDISSVGGTATDVLVNNSLVKINPEGEALLRNSSSFLVLIDGKPSPFESTEALNQIQANTIEKIEIITNPSAKYDAEGITGIINIITKKQKFKGFSGMVNSSYSSNNACSGDFIINYKNEKINFFVGADYKKLVNSVVFDFSRTYTIADTIFSRKEFIEQTGIRPNPNVKFGFDYQIKPNTSISINNSSGTASNLDKEKSVHNKFWSDHHSEYAYRANKEEANVKGFFSSPSISFLHRFNEKGTQLSSDVSFTHVDGNYSFRSNEFIANKNYQSIDSMPERINSSNNYLRNFLVAKADYVWAINDKLKLETGIEFAGNQRDVALDITNFDYNTNQWLPNSLYSNNYVFRQSIYAGYSQWSGQLASFEYQIGIRGEYTDRILEQKQKNEDYIYQKMHFFPSFSLLRALNEKIKLQWSYSRRISRPIEFYLNPFPSTVSSSVINTGNPKLQPYFTNYYEFNITSDFNAFVLNVNNFYIFTKDAISQVLELNEQGTQIMTFRNMNYNKFIGTEISTSFSPAKIIKLSPKINLFSMETRGDIDDYDAHFKTFTYELSLNGSIKILKSTRFQIVTTYAGKSVTQQGYQEPYYFITASLKQDFLNDKLSIVLQARNLFNSNRLNFDEYGKNFNTKLNYQPETNIFSFNISYKFNNFRKSEKMTGKTVDSEG